MKFSDEPSRDIALTWYVIWARNVLVGKSFDELKEIGQKCVKISSDTPLHLGFHALDGRTFDINDEIKGITPLQVIALMYTVIEMSPIPGGILDKPDWLKEGTHIWRLFSVMEAFYKGESI